MLFKGILLLAEEEVKNIKIKKFSILNYDVYLIPDEIFEPFVETSNNLTMNSDEYLKLWEECDVLEMY